MDMDSLLEQLGIKSESKLNYEELNAVEKDTLHQWLDSLSRAQLTLDSVRNYILSMRDSVEEELTKTDNDEKRDIYLKARLKNYMLLASFLSTPDRAKRAIEQELTRFGKAA